ncbi:phosphatidylinositol 3-kinase C2 domain-containing subunit gamma isoform X2 [Dendropsophus ebraccatus]|uniref:phosphatidylinositol 3-kinase C2 domain-containing subunit gamma isoform X2 n=1 Tax=Dendropsophus ebraccatus TaxID=150705 RepID=UPI0038315158
MNRPQNIGFSDYVTGVSPLPQFPAPPGFHVVSPGPVNRVVNEPAPSNVFGHAPAQIFVPASSVLSGPAQICGPAPADMFDSTSAHVLGPAPADIFDSTSAHVLGPASADVFGSTPVHVLGPAPADVFGSTPAHVLGPVPADVFGSTPVHVLGPAPADVFGSTPAHVLGPAPADVFGSTPAHVLGPAPADFFGPAHHSAAGPYGFLTDNWLEERQSWFPQPLPPAVYGEDTEGDTQLQAAPGFRIGFEDYGDASDPPLHYHHLDLPAEGDTWGQRIGPTPWGRSPHSDPQPAGAQGPGSRIPVEDWRIKLQEVAGRQEPEVAAFCDAIWRIRRGYCSSDCTTNPGRIWSVAAPFPDDVTDSQVEVSVIAGDHLTALQTLQRDSAHVEHLLADILHKIQDPVGLAASLYPVSHDPHPAPPPQLYPSLQPPVIPRLQKEGAEPAGRGCHLSVCGRDEYLQLGHSLRSHKILQRQRCIRLRLHMGGDPQGPLARTVEDDEAELGLGGRLEHAQYWQELRRRVSDAVTHYGDQLQYFLYNQSAGVGGVLAAVEEICYLLRSVETQEISEAVRRLSVSSLQLPMNWVQTPQMADPVALSLVELSSALSGLLAVYSRSFHTDFTAESCLMSSRMESGAAVLSCRLFAAHNLPEKWTKSDHVFYLSCSVTYAGRKICPEVKSRSVVASRSFFLRAVWDEMIQLQVPLLALPYESLLVFRLYAVTPAAPAASFLAWSCLPLYWNQQMVQGALLLNMISDAEPPALITPTALDTSLPTLITLQVDFPDFVLEYRRPAAEAVSCDAGGEDVAWRIHSMANRSSVLLLSEVDKQCLWYFRRCPRPPPHLLPLILGSAPGWDPPSISAMYRVLEDWSFSGPLEALGLLSPCFADEKIRRAACRELEQLSCDQLLDILPQLVQAVKFEWRLDGGLVQLLLHRALQSIQVAHRLYWLLTAATSEPHYRGLYGRLVDAVQRCAGRALSHEFSKQRRLLRILEDVAGKVKNSAEEGRKDALMLGLHHLDRFFEEVGSCRLPQDPAIVVKGIERDLCSFFKSNAKPLKISFINSDEQGPNVHLMYKIGDDMRQDVLVLQLVEIMDRIWLHEGLDLRMITYRCMSTGRKQGLIQLVPDSVTLAKIQNKSGLFGPLKDSSMKKWFHNNKTASDNFLFSCAGWCVVTFLLGVCDRHNDNIMLTSDGHMFHIDFGKFLGNAQMFGSIKRDRAPFIFTTEMESFITQGGQCPQRAQEFVKLCCCAYNVLRRHSALIITLLELMLQAGLPELRSVDDLRYVYNRLRPYDSDQEASSYFTSKIKESLESPSVKLNFLIHAFANMTPSDLSRVGEGVTPALAKFIKRAAVKSVRKVHKVGGRLLGVHGDPAGTGGSARGIQLHIWFSDPQLCVLLKHLRNINLTEGSRPSPSLTVSLYSGTWEISRQDVQSQSGTSAPIINQLVQFTVPQLEGLVLRIQVRSKGTFLGQLRLPLSSARLREDVWYNLGA